MSLLAHATVIDANDDNQRTYLDVISNQQELIDFSNLQPSTALIKCDTESDDNLGHSGSQKQLHNHYQATTSLSDNQPSDSDNNQQQTETNRNFFDSDEEEEHYSISHLGSLGLKCSNRDHDSLKSPSHHRLKSARQRRKTVVDRFLTRVGFAAIDLKSIFGAKPSGQIPYQSHFDQDTNRHMSTRASVAAVAQSKRSNSSERSFRGPYRFSRLGIVMAILKRSFGFLFQRSTLALFGAFLIHITLGTVYTLSNVNSYMTSYMRKNGSPNATYGSSMWISSIYSVGQGMSMVLGGYIEKRFSARVACVMGCLLHSLSIMSTSIAVNYGQLAVLLTYGLLPGFGCGLAYMTPMSNGFGWFPHRRGLVAGTILAGFGIGTFVFNMAQTAYVNPDNLSPLPGDDGYFTQAAILDNLPHLFVFLGSIYATMQFIGCCLLFKPPAVDALDLVHQDNVKAGPQDQRPLLTSPDDPASNKNISNHYDNLTSSESFWKAIRSREFMVLFVVFGVTNQGVLFVNAMLKEYAQQFIDDDMYLAWTGSMASIANSLGRLLWGLAIDRYSFKQCFTAITLTFGTLMFLMPFEFILSSKLLYLLCTLGVFGSFSGWMSTYPVHLSRVFGVKNSGMIYGMIFVSQSIGGIITAFGANYLIDHFTRFVPFFVVTSLELFGLAVYHLFYFE